MHTYSFKGIEIGGAHLNIFGCAIFSTAGIFKRQGLECINL